MKTLKDIEQFIQDYYFMLDLALPAAKEIAEINGMPKPDDYDNIIIEDGKLIARYETSYFCGETVTDYHEFEIPWNALVDYCVIEQLRKEKEEFEKEKSLLLEHQLRITHEREKKEEFELYLKLKKEFGNDC